MWNGNENDKNSNYINSSGKTNAIDDKKDECTMIVAKSLLEKKICKIGTFPAITCDDK